MLRPVFGVEQRVRKELQPAWKSKLTSNQKYLGPINFNGWLHIVTDVK